MSVRSAYLNCCCVLSTCVPPSFTAWRVNSTIHTLSQTEQSLPQRVYRERFMKTISGNSTEVKYVSFLMSPLDLCLTCLLSVHTTSVEWNDNLYSLLASLVLRIRRKIPFFHNLGLIFVAWAILPVVYNNILLNSLIVGHHVGQWL